MRKYVVAIVVVLALGYALLRTFVLGWKNALPASASDVHELYVDRFPDGSYYLSARLPEADFRTFATGNHLVEGEPDFWAGTQVAPAGAESWWHASDHPTARYTSTENPPEIVAHYADGRMYLESHGR